MMNITAKNTGSHNQNRKERREKWGGGRMGGGGVWGKTRQSE